MTRLPLSLAALLAFAAAAPAAGAQVHQHDLPIDKQEKFVDLDPHQAETHTLSCPSGQIAVNGSVKVDAVDEPGHPLFVDTRVSRGAGDRSWRFVVFNGNQRGRAQLKLFIVCMGGSAGQHHVLLGATGTDPATAVPETDAAFDAQGSAAAGQDHARRPNCPGAQPASSAERDPTLFPVRPGIAFDPSAGEVEVSEPQLFSFFASGNPFGFLSRGWSFQFDTPGSDVAVRAIASIRCLGTHVGPAGGHHHAFDVSYQRLPGTVRVAPHTRAHDVTVGCPKRNGSFGIIGTHAELAGHARVTGSEPRGDVWAFRLSNRSGHTVHFALGVICVEKRVWHSDGSFPPPAPIPQTLETATTKRRVTVPAGASSAARRTFNVRCANRSHYALSGTASIDSVSAGDVGVFEFIRVTESRATDLGRWRFRIANASVGKAKITLRLECVAPWTEGHSLALSGVDEDRLAKGTLACGNGQFPVQAGYAGRGEPVRSTPGARGRKLRPRWAFAFRGGRAKVSLRCLYESTTVRTGHYHRAFASYKQRRVKLRQADPRTVLVRCPKGRRAVAGALDRRGKRARRVYVIESHSIGRSWVQTLVTLGAKPVRVGVGATCLARKTTGELFE